MAAVPAEDKHYPIINSSYANPQLGDREASTNSRRFLPCRRSRSGRDSALATEARKTKRRASERKRATKVRGRAEIRDNMADEKGLEQRNREERQTGKKKQGGYRGRKDEKGKARVGLIGGSVNWES